MHGAGRVKSRSAASKEIKGEEVKKELNKKGIEIKSENIKFLAEEAPEVYKDIDEVIKSVEGLGINKKVIRLKPLAVIMS
ncbi:MAG: RtcB family protein [archaeon]